MASAFCGAVGNNVTKAAKADVVKKDRRAETLCLSSDEAEVCDCVRVCLFIEILRMTKAEADVVASSRNKKNPCRAILYIGLLVAQFDVTLRK